MQDSSLDTDSPANKWLVCWIPGTILVLAMAIDFSGGLTFTVAPVTFALALLVFSFVLTPRQLAGWAAIFVMATALTIWSKRVAWANAGLNVEAMMATRTLAAAATGMLACLLARSRHRDLLSLREVHRLLDQMEIPVITSDRDGWLMHLNPKATELLGKHVASGSPFFEHFSVLSEKGKSIQSYVNLATGSTTGPVEINLAVGPHRSEIHLAIMLRVDIGSSRQVMTLLYPNHPEPTSLVAND